MGIGEATGQWKTFFLIVGHFCGSEGKLVCFISTIEKTPRFLVMLPSIKIHLQWGGEAIKAHAEENIFFPCIFQFVVS